MTTITSFIKPTSMSSVDVASYIKMMLSGEVEVFSVSYTIGYVKEHPKVRGYPSLKFLIKSNGKFKEFFNFKYDPYGPVREILKIENRDIYNAMFKIVEDIVQMPIGEFTNGNFDYL